MFTREILPCIPPIQIRNTNLSCDDAMTLLGLDLDYQLNFDKYVNGLQEAKSI